MNRISWLSFGLCLAVGLIAQDRGGLEYYCRNTDGVALHGYSPVSYFQRGKAEPGKQAFALDHGGITYWFTDAEQIGLFKENPERYEPAHGGWCSVMMGSSGNRAEANPEAFKIVDGRLLLFYRGQLNNGAKVDGLQIWNSRKNEAALLRKADKQWRQIRDGSKKSTVIDVGDSAIPERVKKQKPAALDVPAWQPGDTRLNGARLQAFSATYQSSWGTMTLTLDPSSDLDQSPTLNVLAAMRYPNAMVVENYILKQKTLETRYCFRPLVSGPESHYLAAFFEEGGVRGSRSYFLKKQVAEIDASLPSPVFEAQLSGYVLASAKLETGMRGKLPCYDPFAFKTYWRGFEVMPPERVVLRNKDAYEARPVVFDKGTSSQATVWLIDKPPYVIRRVRMVSGSEVVQELTALH